MKTAMRCHHTHKRMATIRLTLASGKEQQGNSSISQGPPETENPRDTCAELEVQLLPESSHSLSWGVLTPSHPRHPTSQAPATDL